MGTRSFVWIEWQPLVEMLIDDHGGIACQQQRMAIGLRFRGTVRGDIAAGADRRFDDHRLAQRGLQPVGEKPGERVSAVPAGKPTMHLDGRAWILGLRQRLAGAGVKVR